MHLNFASYLDFPYDLHSDSNQDSWADPENPVLNESTDVQANIFNVPTGDSEIDITVPQVPVAVSRGKNLPFKRPDTDLQPLSIPNKRIRLDLESPLSTTDENVMITSGTVCDSPLILDDVPATMKLDRRFERETTAPSTPLFLPKGSPLRQNTPLIYSRSPSVSARSSASCRDVKRTWDRYVR